MAWRETKVEDQRKHFIQKYLEKRSNLSDLCRQFEISRKCAYKWLKRYADEGFEGLKDRSRAPLTQAGATDPDTVDKILKLKFKYSKWGPKKILAKLAMEQACIEWPSSTTIGKIFDRNGLTERRKLRKRLAERNDPLSNCNASNDIWCI